PFVTQYATQGSSQCHRLRFTASTISPAIPMAIQPRPRRVPSCTAIAGSCGNLATRAVPASGGFRQRISVRHHPAHPWCVPHRGNRLRPPPLVQLACPSFRALALCPPAPAKKFALEIQPGFIGVGIRRAQSLAALARLGVLRILPPRNAKLR